MYNFAVEFDRIESIEVVVIEQLLAEDAARRRIAVIDSEQARGFESPVDVVFLYPVNLALEFVDELVQLDRVGHDPVGRRQVRPVGVAPVAAGGCPAVKLDSAILDCVAEGAEQEGLLEGVLGWDSRGRRSRDSLDIPTPETAANPRGSAACAGEHQAAHSRRRRLVRRRSGFRFVQLVAV